MVKMKPQKMETIKAMEKQLKKVKARNETEESSLIKLKINQHK
jgi:hypothetical protein